MLETSQQALRPFRQGDVLLVPCSEIPAIARKEAPAGERVVLAEGERTGHAHTMLADRVSYFREDGSGSGAYVHVAGPSPVDLTHEEHDTLAIPPGNYRVVQQRQYQPRAAPTAVAD